MSEDKKDVKFHEEVQKMEYEPLDETELKLIHWSWGLGVTLLVVLWFVSYLFPSAHRYPRPATQTHKPPGPRPPGAPALHLLSQRPMRLAARRNQSMSHLKCSFNHPASGHVPPP